MWKWFSKIQNMVQVIILTTLFIDVKRLRFSSTSFKRSLVRTAVSKLDIFRFRIHFVSFEQRAIFNSTKRHLKTNLNQWEFISDRKRTNQKPRLELPVNWFWMNQPEAAVSVSGENDMTWFACCDHTFESLVVNKMPESKLSLDDFNFIAFIYAQKEVQHEFQTWVAYRQRFYRRHRRVPRWEGRRASSVFGKNKGCMIAKRYMTNTWANPASWYGN